jgi:hypothetical protein
LLRIRSSPTKRTGLSSFEILFGFPHPLVKGLQGDLKEIGNLTHKWQMQALGLTLLKISDWVRERLPISLTTPTHPYKPRRAAWVKEWNVQLLKPNWRGPFVVVLSTPITIKVAEIILWNYHSQVAHYSHVATLALCRRAGPCPQETRRDHERRDVSPALVIPEANLHLVDT